MMLHRGSWRWLVFGAIVVLVSVWLALSAHPVRGESLVARGVGRYPTGGPVGAVAALRRPPTARVAPRPIRPVTTALRRSVAGGASWYCDPGRSACTAGYRGGHYAAAGPKLRALLGAYMGRTVTVCAGAACTRVEVVDWCGCPGGRVLDLYADAFRDLAPLSAGVVEVTVHG